MLCLRMRFILSAVRAAGRLVTAYHRFDQSSCTSSHRTRSLNSLDVAVAFSTRKAG